MPLEGLQWRSRACVPEPDGLVARSGRQFKPTSSDVMPLGWFRDRCSVYLFLLSTLSHQIWSVSDLQNLPTITSHLFPVNISPSQLNNSHMCCVVMFPPFPLTIPTHHLIPPPHLSPPWARHPGLPPFPEILVRHPAQLGP